MFELHRRSDAIVFLLAVLLRRVATDQCISGRCPEQNAADPNTCRENGGCFGSAGISRLGRSDNRKYLVHDMLPLAVRIPTVKLL